jgi:hypothetical protein
MDDKDYVPGRSDDEFDRLVEPEVHQDVTLVQVDCPTV